MESLFTLDFSPEEFSRKNSGWLCRYIKYLFEYLGTKYCFLSGAFVIEDFDGKLFQMLYSDPKKWSITTGATHTLYNQYSQNNNIEYTLHESKLEIPVHVECKCDDVKIDLRSFRSCKWYKFDDNGKQFIYLKPESDPTISLNHAYGAIKTYLLKKSNTSCKQSRREDCGKSCKYVRNTKDQKNLNILSANGPSGTSQDLSTVFDNYDTAKCYIQGKENDIQINIDLHARKGDEVYISSLISNYIFYYIYTTNTPFRHHSDTDTDTDMIDSNTVILTKSWEPIKSGFVGGKTRRRRKYKK